MEEQEIQLNDYLEVIRRRKWIILSVFLIAILGSSAVTFLMTPIYEASTTLWIEKEGGGTFLDEFGFRTFEGIETQCELMRSRVIAEEVVRRLNLHNPGDFREAVEELQGKVKVEPIRKTNLLKVKVCDPDPNRAKQIANTLAEVFVELNLKYDRGEAKSVYNFTKRQLQIAKENLERSENRLKEYREKTGISVLGEEARSNIQKIVELEGKVAELRARRIGIQSKLEEVRRQLHLQGEWLISGGDLRRLRKDLVKLELEEDRDKKQLEEVKALLSARIKNEVLRRTSSVTPYLSDITKPIYQHLLTELVDLETEAYSLEAIEQALLQAIEKYTSKLNLLPEKELELARLTRAAEVNEEIYKMLLTKNEEARIAEAMEIGNVRIVDPAVTPDKPIKPKKKLNAFIGGVLGLMFGFVFAFLREHLDSSIKGVEDVERLVDLPIIGVIPSIDQKREKKFWKR